MCQTFLCREALTFLGVIANDFPSPTTMASNDNTANMTGYDDVTCSFPKRQMEPPRFPSKLPNGYSPTEDNVEALKEWLLDYYSATTFNVCEHQPLPLMKCE